MLRERLLKIDETTLVVTPTEYSMTLMPFQNILKNHGAEKAKKLFAYVYFMRDPRSLYSASSEKEKHQQILKALFPNNDFKMDKNIQEALEFYNSEETSTMKLLRSARSSMDKLQKWLGDIDTTNEDYDALKHVRILESMGKTVTSIKILEEAAQKESNESTTFGSVELNEWSR